MTQYDLYLGAPDVEAVQKSPELTAILGGGAVSGFLGLSLNEGEMRSLMERIERVAAASGQERVGLALDVSYRDEPTIPFSAAQDIACVYADSNFPKATPVASMSTDAVPHVHVFGFGVTSENDEHSELRAIEVDKLDGHVWTAREKLEKIERFHSGADYELAAYDLRNGTQSEKLAALERLKCMQHSAKKFMLNVRKRNEPDAVIVNAIEEALNDIA